jgi:selenocysteine lyase/cysteine desulfurase
MKLEDLLNSEKRAELFPTVCHGIYLNNAAVAPLPAFSIDAYMNYARLCSQKGEKHWEQTAATVEETRNMLAEYLGCNSDEIAFTRNVSEGLSILAGGLDWHSGDKVLISDIEFPANVYPWLNLLDRGITTGYIRNFSGRTGLKQIEEAISDETRVVSLSSVQFFSGYRAELEEIGAFLKARNVLFCVDAVQHIGAFPLDVRKSRIDFLAGAAHKWLMCGEGLGFVYCRKELAESLRQPVVGWQSVEDWTSFLSYKLELKPSALRFETGGVAVAGIYALNSSLKFIRQIGIENISAHILKLSKMIRKMARERNFSLITGPEEPEEANCSGITTFKIESIDADDLAQKLVQAKVFVSVRAGHIRLSPSYYNTEDEIVKFFEILDSILTDHQC